MEDIWDRSDHLDNTLLVWICTATVKDRRHHSCESATILLISDRFQWLIHDTARTNKI